MSGMQIDVARNALVMRTIPDDIDTVAVTSSEGSVSLSQYSGKYIYLRSAGITITLLRANSSPSLVAGVGFTVGSSQWEEVFVNPDGKMTLYHRSTGSVNLLIAHDTEVK